MTRPLISIVIPTLNEQAALSRLFNELDADGSASLEVIVSDGGSDDTTEFVARGAGAKVVTGPRGRSQQLATGARAARGDVIWFLHADSRLSPGTLGAIRAAVDVDGACGGNFRLVFDGEDGFSRWLTGFYAWFRQRGLYYGDSGIFIRHDVLEKIGDVRPIALMEDYDLSRRLERHGGDLLYRHPSPDDIIAKIRKPSSGRDFLRMAENACPLCDGRFAFTPSAAVLPSLKPYSGLR